MEGSSKSLNVFKRHICSFWVSVFNARDIALSHLHTLGKLGLTQLRCLPECANNTSNMWIFECVHTINVIDILGLSQATRHIG